MIGNCVKYKDIHFRIDSGYQFGRGFDETKSAAFNEEITKLFIDAGWSVKQPTSRGTCATVNKEKNRLYLHPTDVSGELETTLIPEVENILSNATTFSHYKTDVYQELADMSDEEYREHLDSKRENIEQDLIEMFKTKRRNLYIASWFAVVERVKEKYRIARITNHIGRTSDDIEWIYVENVFKELVERNAIITAETKNGKGYRTNREVS